MRLQHERLALEAGATIRWNRFIAAARRRQRAQVPVQQKILGLAGLPARCRRTRPAN